MVTLRIDDYIYIFITCVQETKCRSWFMFYCCSKCIYLPLWWPLLAWVVAAGATVVSPASMTDTSIGASFRSPHWVRNSFISTQPSSENKPSINLSFTIHDLKFVYLFWFLHPCPVYDKPRWYICVKVILTGKFYLILNRYVKATN